MKTMTCAMASLAVMVASVTVGVLLTGCQTPGVVVSSEKSAVCPLCATETVTSPIKGVTHKKHICPTCKKVTTIDPSAPVSLQDYVDPEVRMVQVCHHCQAAIVKCPDCRVQ